ncbi:hypothetical protein FA15DRAFT_669969 [Coprinopsis marcescibilis]|uniref:t-SNARE coiled-coil homology domain-containing protein n=1 Tax=Coprinopsis marcescibilis TaxID=230819 RepID=A0A5C3KUL0_COPMA|nr:hypothetical protein FA15DRAFT_669969 [Coprinopsis marcescibilis]
MSLAKLTAVSTKTLSLLLERQRLQTLPSSFGNQSSPLHDLNPVSTPTSSLNLSQIKKNLEQLRNGVLAMQEKEGESEAVGLLKNQYERMRGMLGVDAEGVPSFKSKQQEATRSNPDSSSSTGSSSSASPVPREPLPSIGLSSGNHDLTSKKAALFLSSSSSTPSSAAAHTRTDSTTVFPPYKDDPRVVERDDDGSSDEAGVLLQSQRFMMQDQDQRLDELSHSINRQHHISLQIGDELEVHQGLLEDLDAGIDGTAGRLGSAKKRLDRVAKGIKENSSVFMIGVLIFVLLILIIVLKT